MFEDESLFNNYVYVSFKHFTNFKMGNMYTKILINICLTTMNFTQCMNVW